ncbi:MAG: hypothetical protein ACO3IT_07905 [Ilumatobacteraceae bacterium]
MSISTIFVFLFAGLLIVSVSLYEKQITAIRGIQRRATHKQSLAETRVQMLEKELDEHKKIHGINEQIIEQLKKRISIMEAYEQARLAKVREAKRKYAAKARAKKKGGEA